MNDERKPTTNSTFAIGGVSFSADSFVVAESFVLRLNICGAKPIPNLQNVSYNFSKKNI
jgi:hypothetical protein